MGKSLEQQELNSDPQVQSEVEWELRFLASETPEWVRAIASFQRIHQAPLPDGWKLRRTQNFGIEGKKDGSMEFELIHKEEVDDEQEQRNEDGNVQNSKKTGNNEVRICISKQEFDTIATHGGIIGWVDKIRRVLKRGDVTYHFDDFEGRHLGIPLIIETEHTSREGTQNFKAPDWKALGFGKVKEVTGVITNRQLARARNPSKYIQRSLKNTPRKD